VPEVRSIFNKGGGNMGEENSVSFLFTRAGQIYYTPAAGGADTVMEAAMDAGADDVESSEEGHIITTKPDDFMAVQKALSDKLGEPEKAEITWLPNNPMDLDDAAYEKLEKLVDTLESNDDVQKVITAAA
jgi:transcriptional/translational regulatory protein YebC/TACO1